MDSNDVGSISEHGSSSDSESEVERRPLRDGESGHREGRPNRSSIPHSRTATFKEEEMQREVSASFGGETKIRVYLFGMNTVKLRSHGFLLSSAIATTVANSW